MALMYDLPLQSDINNWRPIQLLLAPPGMKSIEYNVDKSKQEYINEGFVKILMGVCNAYTQRLRDYKQGKRKQHGIKHYVSATIHTAIGDTLNQQIIVILSFGTKENW